MTDDQHLIASYFGALALVVACALVAFICLRHPFAAFARVLAPRWTATGLRRFLFVLIFFPALAGVFSVSFYDCTHATYDTIVADRTYVQTQARVEVANGLQEIVLGVLFLGFVLAVARKHDDGQAP